MNFNVLRGFGLVAVLALGLGGCAAALPRPVETNAALGKVVVYRNGVAYFERYAKLQGKALRLRVPGERIDDLLKSLTVVDASSGAPIPVSFPTVEQLGDEVEISLQLPTPAPAALRISYVTESPAWKPTYRLKLSKKGPAKLEAWAVVDNVSGEDWTKVAVGVGSTSALSFRYDLHSVRVVQRETLSAGEVLGLAPPTGGSPYAVAGKELAVLANVSTLDLRRSTKQQICRLRVQAWAQVAPHLLRKPRGPHPRRGERAQTWTTRSAMPCPAQCRTRKKSASKASRSMATRTESEPRSHART
jgi:Domain of unknown function (DUF4139)